MRILDQEKIAKAWFYYLRHGEVRDDLLRPVIARSWKRSPKLNYNSMTLIERTPQVKQKELQEKNEAIIQAASSLVNYIVNISPDCIIVLCDAEGYTIKSFHRYKRDIITDTCYAEDRVGCCTAGILMQEGQPVFVSGFEHLCANWHSATTGGVPLKNAKGKVIGSLLFSYPFNKKPIFSMDSLKAAGKIIEKSLASNLHYTVESSPHFGQLLDAAEVGMIVADKTGRTVNVNRYFTESMGLTAPDLFANCHLSDFMDEHSASLIRSDRLLKYTNHITTVRAGDKTAAFKVADMKCIRGNHGKDHKLIVLHKCNQPLPKSSRPRMSSVSVDVKDAKNISQNIVGKSPAITHIKEMIKRVARTPSTVLIQGESGTGKELVANSIHAASGRSGPLIPINCGALPKELLESELFGYDGGSFTGANKGGKVGKLEMAHNGTLFLDEIGEMPIDMQVALLRFLEDKVVVRLGSTSGKKIDVRVISATNRDLIKAISNNTFRQDLYFRLNVINLRLPPLREIQSDIPLLARHILNQISQQFELPKMELEAEAIMCLCNYEWPGNMRELRNIMERAAVYAEAKTISAELMAYCLNSQSQQAITKFSETKKSERDKMIEILDKHNWNLSQASKFMGISRSKIYNMLKFSGINLADYRSIDTKGKGSVLN